MPPISPLPRMQSSKHSLFLGQLISRSVYYLIVVMSQLIWGWKIKGIPIALLRRGNLLFELVNPLRNFSVQEAIHRLIHKTTIMNLLNVFVFLKAKRHARKFKQLLNCSLFIPNSRNTIILLTFCKSSQGKRRQNANAFAIVNYMLFWHHGIHKISEEIHSC